MDTGTSSKRRRVKYSKTDTLCIKTTMEELETKNILTLDM